MGNTPIAKTRLDHGNRRIYICERQVNV
jgi:hypothetical protein